MDPFNHIYSVYIKAPPDRVWHAITDGDDTVKYYYGTRVHRPGTPARRSATPTGWLMAADGKVVEIDPGRRVVDVVPPALGARDRRRGPGADDLGDRARRGGWRADAPHR